MRKQNERAGQSESRKRVSSVFQEEQAVSKAFQISNFYTNQRLNIAELKQRLEQFKKAQKPTFTKPNDTPQKQNLPLINQASPEDVDPEGHSTAKFMNISDRIPKQSEPSGSPKKSILNNLYGGQGKLLQDAPARQTLNVNTTTDRSFTIQRKEQARQANYRIVREVQKSRYEPKVKTALGSRSKQSQEVSGYVLHRGSAKNKYKAERTESSKQSDTSQSRSLSQLVFEGSIRVSSSRHLNDLQKEIHHLWEHYQLLTKILLSLKEGNRQQKNTIVKYVEDVCSDRFQFVRELLNTLQKQSSSSRSQLSFVKRLTKGVIHSRLYENLSLVYVSLGICLKMQADSHLVNFVGYCCSNVIFLLKLVRLTHALEAPLKFSQHTENILAVIEQFEEESYKNRVMRVGELVLRMEHNNEIISIVQQRICGRMSKEFQNIITTFLRNVDMDTKPLLEYAHYIYQFLAFHLAKLNIIGQFSFVEMAPTPYLNLPKQKTVIIEPWEVLFALRGEDTYIRAYSEKFLGQIQKYCNVVYWSDLLPDQIEDLLQKLPYGSKLYRFHCRYENDRFLKLLWRIGCDVDNTIIIDREEANFKYDREMGLELPWRGKQKDNRFLSLLNGLLPLLNSNSIPLRKSFPPLKEKIMAEQRQSRQKRRSQSKSGVNNESRMESMLPRNIGGR